MENKYEKGIKKIFSVIGAVLLIIFAVLIFVAAVFGSYFIPGLNILIIPLIFASPFLIDYALSFGFFNDKFESDVFITNGETTSFYYRVPTKKFLNRQVKLYKIMALIYAIYGITMMIIFFATGLKEVAYIIMSIISMICCPIFIFISVIKRENIRIKKYESEE